MVVSFTPEQPRHGFCTKQACKSRVVGVGLGQFWPLLAARIGSIKVQAERTAAACPMLHLEAGLLRSLSFASVLPRSATKVVDHFA